MHEEHAQTPAEGPDAPRRRRAAPPGPREAEARQRAILLRIVRVAFLVLILTVTLLNVIKVSEDPDPQGLPLELATRWWIPVLASVFLAGVFLATDLLTPRKKIATISGVMFGLLAGLVATVAIGYVIDLVATTWGFAGSPIAGAVKVLVGISLCYLGVVTVLQTQDDFRLVIPYVEFAKQLRGTRPLLLDSSVLIDARIVDIGETGLIQSPIVIPSFVVSELQLLADSRDKMARAKGRRGLDVIGRLQRSARLDVTIDETPVPGKAVDQMLVELARQMPGVLVTTDVGLSRVAGIQDVPVLNINDLANAMKPSVIPGERMRIRLIKRGEQARQGVGYLEDGTMVVAEDGAEHVGSEVDVQVTSSLQTSAGRLIFARIDGPADPDRDSPPELQSTDEPDEDTGEARDADAPEHPDDDPAPSGTTATDGAPARKPGPFPPNPPRTPSRGRSSRARNPRR